MKKSCLLISVLTLIYLTSCKNEDEIFGETKKLTEFNNTEFIPTLESNINANKNTIYCATLLFAWQEVKNIIKQPLRIDKKFNDLILVNNSKSHINALHPNEYKVSGKVVGGGIVTKAEFSKSLPFETKLTSFKSKIHFKNTKVRVFGALGHNTEKIKNIEIVYFKNEKNFIIKLLPKNKEHEIILFKPGKSNTSMVEMISVLDKKETIGKKQKKNKWSSWKYQIRKDDKIVIPKINFNIETNYSTLEGKTFHADKIQFIIDKAWQKTAFKLDEKGAEVVSDACFQLKDLDEEREKPRPKNLIFDQPFFVLLQRTDEANPYFAMWVANAELMITE